MLVISQPRTFIPTMMSMTMVGGDAGEPSTDNLHPRCPPRCSHIHPRFPGKTWTISWSWLWEWLHCCFLQILLWFVWNSLKRWMYNKDIWEPGWVSSDICELSGPSEAREPIKELLSKLITEPRSFFVNLMHCHLFFWLISDKAAILSCRVRERG